MWSISHQCAPTISDLSRLRLCGSVKCLRSKKIQTWYSLGKLIKNDLTETWADFLLDYLVKLTRSLHRLRLALPCFVISWKARGQMFARELSIEICKQLCLDCLNLRILLRFFKVVRIEEGLIWLNTFVFAEDFLIKSSHLHFSA